jgi:hypothetical protein
MEVPSDDECLKIKALLYPHLPDYLCHPSDGTYNQINTCLYDLNLYGGAELYERKRLFGNQFRYLFGSSGDILAGLNGLIDAIEIFARKGLLVPYDKEKIDSVVSHKLMQLNFDLKSRTFYHLFVSGLVILLAVRRLEYLKHLKMSDLLIRYKREDGTMYGKMFEKHVVSLMEKGVSFFYRNLEEDESHIGSFPRSDIFFFTYVVYTPVQVWFQSIERTGLLGLTMISSSILYYPVDADCYTVDAILVEKKQTTPTQTEVVVNFIQATVSNNHPVSPGGFFAMFMLVKLINIANGCKAVVNFYFVVPEDVYSEFHSSEARYLRFLFEDIHIFVMRINEAGILSRNGTNGQSGKGLLDSGSSAIKQIEEGNEDNKSLDHTSETKRILLAQNNNKKTSHNSRNNIVLWGETSYDSKPTQTEITVEEPLKKFLLNEIQKQKKNSQPNRIKNAAVLILKTFDFGRIPLNLVWNKNIKCVVKNSRVLVENNSVKNGEDNLVKENFQCNLIEDSKMIVKDSGNNSVENNRNNRNKNYRVVVLKKEDKKEKNKKENFKKKAISNPGLVVFDNKKFETKFGEYVKDVLNYLRICTLFCKKSQRRNTKNKKKKIQEKILNLLTKFKKNINVDCGSGGDNDDGGSGSGVDGGIVDGGSSSDGDDNSDGDIDGFTSDDNSGGVDGGSGSVDGGSINGGTGDGGTGDDNIEVGFSKYFKEKDVYLLLGCLNLRLQNLEFNSESFLKVRLIFHSLSQINFLKRIQEQVFSKLNPDIGIFINIKKKVILKDDD